MDAKKGKEKKRKESGGMKDATCRGTRRRLKEQKN
jgi:hypothetical protein